MKKAKPADDFEDDMLPEYKVPANAERGKYARLLGGRTLLVSIDVDLQKKFPDAQAVNAALRTVAGRTHRPRKNGSHRKSA